MTMAQTGTTTETVTIVWYGDGSAHMNGVAQKSMTMRAMKLKPPTPPIRIGDLVVRKDGVGCVAQVLGSPSFGTMTVKDVQGRTKGDWDTPAEQWVRIGRVYL